MSLDIDKELLKTLHIHSDELPFMEFKPGVFTRMLQVRPSEKLVVTQLHAEPFAETTLHSHPSPVYGWTLQGHWGHDKQYLYRAGTYIFETPTVVHKFINGPEPTDAVFISTGDLEFIDPETLEVIAVATPQQMLDQYMAECEKLGFKPKVLS